MACGKKTKKERFFAQRSTQTIDLPAQPNPEWLVPAQGLDQVFLH